MSTLDQLKAEVIFNTFDGPKYLERAGVFVNSAARDLARRSLWGGGETTTTVDDDGVAQSAFGRVTAVWSTDTQGHKQDRHEFAGDAGSPGTQYDAFGDYCTSPSYKTVVGNSGLMTLQVTPVPATRQIVVAGNRLPAAMSGGSDVCELGPDADDALVLFARAKLYLREDDKEMHDGLWQAYLDEVRRFTLGTRPVAEGPRLTPGTWGDGSFGGY